RRRQAAIVDRSNALGFALVRGAGSATDGDLSSATARFWPAPGTGPASPEPAVAWRVTEAPRDGLGSRKRDQESLSTAAPIAMISAERRFADPDRPWAAQRSAVRATGRRPSRGAMGRRGKGPCNG